MENAAARSREPEKVGRQGGGGRGEGGEGGAREGTPGGELSLSPVPASVGSSRS